VARLVKTVENECSEEQLLQGKCDEFSPAFDENDSQFMLGSSFEMYNVLLDLTTGEAHAMVGRYNGQGWLA
jgi:hypothetical protein